jgi:hypothetical protein
VRQLDEYIAPNTWWQSFQQACEQRSTAATPLAFNAASHCASFQLFNVLGLIYADHTLPTSRIKSSEVERQKHEKVHCNLRKERQITVAKLQSYAQLCNLLAS